MDDFPLSILTLVACHFGKATSGQVSRASNVSLERVHRVSRQLWEDGYLGRICVPVSRPAELSSFRALFVGLSKDDPTDTELKQRSNALRQRHRKVPAALPTMVLYAIQGTVNEAGGAKACTAHPDQLAHDLQAGEILLTNRRANRIPNLTEEQKLSFGNWRHGDWLRAKGLDLAGYHPDAAEVEDGKIVSAVDYGGDYLFDDLARLRRAAFESRVTITLW
jgi:hypothetical protein